MAAAVATLIVAGVSFGSTLRLHGTKVAPARSRIVMADVGGPYTLHAYEHCQFCTRTRFVMGWSGVPFATRIYGYGEGADPEKCDG